MTKVVILGASGSIGTQTLDILLNETDKFELVGFSVGHQVNKIDEILKKFPSVKYVTVIEQSDQEKVKDKHKNLDVYFGNDGLIALINAAKPNLIVNALVGFVGLKPTLFALENGIDVALANKESIVVGGELINKAKAKTGAKIYPVDSEHVAIAKCLGNNLDLVKEVIITASGGPFFGKTRDELVNVTKKEALNHPTWKMGPKITIDSATLMNKGFEIIEAHYLFSLPSEKIKFVIHPQSRVHAIVKYIDESFLFDIGPTDMHVPISYALHKCTRTKNVYSSINLDALNGLTFVKGDRKDYSLINLAYDALEKGGFYPTILNASNEIAVYSFLDDKITFLDITDVIIHIYNMEYDFINDELTMENIEKVDKYIRKLTSEYIERLNA